MTTSVRELKKSSWKEFVGYSALMYMGSMFDGTLEDVAKRIEAYDEPEFEVNRTYVRGVTDIQFRTENDTISHLSKVGRVYTYGNYFLIHNEAMDNNIVIYRFK